MGIGMELGISDGNSGLYRNDEGAVYPYNIGSIMNITGNSASEPGYYYFYYNIEVEVPCENISASIFDIERNNKRILKITDVLGRDRNGIKNELLFYLYDDGTVEKLVIIE
jgi:hypothetical protein